MGKAVLLNEDGSIALVDAPNQGKLSWFYKMLNCHSIEIVRPKGLPEDHVIIIDDEGKYKKDRYVNFVASWYYQTQEHGDPVVGKALIMKEYWSEDGANIGGMDEIAAALLMARSEAILPEAFRQIKRRLGNMLRRNDDCG